MGDVVLFSGFSISLNNLSKKRKLLKRVLIGEKLWKVKFLLKVPSEVNSCDSNRLVLNRSLKLGIRKRALAFFVVVVEIDNSKKKRGERLLNFD